MLALNVLGQAAFFGLIMSQVKDSLPSTLMQDHSPIHGRWTFSDRNDHHDDWDSDGMGMGSSSYGRGASGAKSGPAVVAAAKGTGWVSCSARN